MHDSQKRAITVQGRFMAPVCIGAPRIYPGIQRVSQDIYRLRGTP